MCQIIPFTLPCCNRVYVEISKLPSCPDEWPKKKCPKDFCLRIRHNAEERKTGTCWRCKAGMAGKIGQDREGMRPGIDKAAIVDGLEEFDAHDRRKMIEARGNCWFCGAKSGCESCHSKKIPEDVPEDGSPSTPSKRSQVHTGFAKARRPAKRPKVEPVSSRVATLNSAFLNSVNLHAQKTPPALPSMLDPVPSPYLPPSNDGLPYQQTFTSSSPSISSPFSDSLQTRGRLQYNDFRNNNRNLAHSYMTQPFTGTGQDTQYPLQYTQQSFDFAPPSGDFEFSTYPFFFTNDPNANSGELDNASENHGANNSADELDPSHEQLSPRTKLDPSLIDPSLTRIPNN